MLVFVSYEVEEEIEDEDDVDGPTTRVKVFVLLLPSDLLVHIHTINIQNIYITMVKEYVGK